jgi:hypothetical protein
MIDGTWQEHAPLDLDGKPALLFFTLDDSCECMQELLESADIQIKSWPDTTRGGARVHRINIEQRQDLASQYKIFRVPSMILLDAEGEIFHRQDYQSIEDGPLQLEEFEAKIQEIQGFGLK